MSNLPSGSAPVDGGDALLPLLVRLVADRAQAPSIHRVRVCLFLGAGADISSGGLSFADLKRQAVEEIARDVVFDVTLPEYVEARFEELFVRLPSEDRALLIGSLFRRLQPLSPSDAYKLVVLLAEAGGIDAVITTNFDLMLERAQSQLGRDVFQVFAPGFARPYMSHLARYDLPKKPYVKLHGDLASRSVVWLTANELESASYDSSMLDLVRSIFHTHDLILAGYSGFDPALARVIGDAVAGTACRVFWCGPSAPRRDAPLYARIADRTTIVRATFDRLMMDIARPVLERPHFAATEPTYLDCLFEWRVEYCNREYLHTYGERAGRSIVDLFAYRPAIEERLTSFLLPNRPLALVVGPSGFGKTTIGMRLHRRWKDDATTRILLIRSRALADNADLEQYVATQLGGLGSRDPLTLFRLEQWLRERGVRLILFVDGLNEFSPDLTRCVHFFRGILRFCYFLPETDSALRLVVTIRQETWNSMLPHVDPVQLRKVLWGDGDVEDSSRAITCNAFTDEELEDALARLREHGRVSIDADRLAPRLVERLRDPYLLRLVADAAADGMPPMPNSGIYQQTFQAKLARANSLVSSATLRDVLTRRALDCFISGQDRFREVDVEPAALRADILRAVKDAGIIVDAGDGFFQFDHDRTFEYFLALAFASGIGPPLETLPDLGRFLGRVKSESRPVAAARLYFRLAPQQRFHIIAAALKLADRSDARVEGLDAERLFGFAREVLTEMVEDGEPYAERYLHDAMAAAVAGPVGVQQLRALVQTVPSLPAERAIPLLTRAARAGSSLAATEAGIYATDILTHSYLMAGCPPVDLMADSPYAGFLADPTIPRWQQLGRFLAFLAQFGPDNSSAREYAAAAQPLAAALQALRDPSAWHVDDAAAVADHILANCDRLVFNATPQGLTRFFGNPQRPAFVRLLDRLATGDMLVESDLAVFEAYTQSLTAHIEYHLAHALFVLSSFNDYDATLRLAEARFATFTNETPPEEIDFFQAVLVYLHIVHARAYDEQRFAPWEASILDGWPDVLLYRPGVERGERRGFHDPFDRFFEDGFGVLYAYGCLRPSRFRVSTDFGEYRRLLARQKESQLPLYTTHLERFLREDRIEEALQVLQALAGVIVAWPLEGLLSLRDVVGHPHPRIRRATVRVLAEAYCRHPEETLRFLKTSGVAVSDDDLLTIKVRQDASVGRRQIDEEQWARIGHFLLREPAGRDLFVRCLRHLLTADSFGVAVAGILQLLGLVEPT